LSVLDGGNADFRRRADRDNIHVLELGLKVSQPKFEHVE